MFTHWDKVGTKDLMSFLLCTVIGCQQQCWRALKTCINLSNGEVFELAVWYVTGPCVLWSRDSVTVLNLPYTKMKKRSLPFPPNQTLQKSCLMPNVKYEKPLKQKGSLLTHAWQSPWWLLGKFQSTETTRAAYCCLKVIRSPKSAYGEPLSPTILLDVFMTYGRPWEKTGIMAINNAGGQRKCWDHKRPRTIQPLWELERGVRFSYPEKRMFWMGASPGFIVECTEIQSILKERNKPSVWLLIRVLVYSNL